MEEKVLNKILENTYTLMEVRRRVNVLKTYLVFKLFDTQNEVDEVNIQSKMSAQFNAEDISWLEDLDKRPFEQLNHNNIYIVFNKIEQMINQSSVLNVYLPFEVNSQIKTIFGQHMRKLFGKVILFDIKYDPNIIAGCALSWQGIYRDYSLRKRIQDNKALLLQNFKKYLEKN